MRHIFLIFIFASTNLFSQTYYKMKPNDDKQGKFKDFPYYIEIDTTEIKDPKTIKVKYNGVVIEPDGNRFYLKTMPFASETKLEIEPPKDPDYKQKVMEHFAKNHTNDKGRFYEIRADHDSIYLGSDYKAVIEIDNSKVKNINNVTILFNDLPLERKGNKFFIQYKIPFLYENSYELTINNSEENQSLLKIKKYVYGLMPSSTPETKPIDYVMIADKSPVLNSKEFKSFDEYFISSLKNQKIEIYGKLILSYTIMTDGSTRFEGIKVGELTDTQKKTIETIITDLKGWIPGEDEGKKVNVNVYAVYNFRK